MMANRIYKKNSRNGSICLYLGKRDFVDHVDHVDIVDGVLKVDTSELDGRKVFVQLSCFFHYGKEDLDLISLSFRKDIWMHHVQIYPPPAEDKPVTTPMQDVLMKKAEEGAHPFTFNIPANLPCSVTFLPAAWDKGKVCGVDFKIKAYIANEADDPDEKIDKKDTCQLIIRKIQFAPDKLLPGPEVNIYKQFMFSGKTIHLEASTEKEVYNHGDPIQLTKQQMLCSIQLTNTPKSFSVRNFVPPAPMDESCKSCSNGRARDSTSLCNCTTTKSFSKTLWIFVSLCHCCVFSLYVVFCTLLLYDSETTICSNV
ncbi:arrestin 3b, retinal (X-arrestin) isoform X3 [Ictalurus punctatus]|uniref:Arrestin-C n=1 Tax=Ictalurus punctatus TaxID=7998 RepID=A0A2D0RGJ4_ICTPU|nr:arrestin 3b, retinal (X-arrestin) isoform X3 [Ictalurus punctatus]